MLAPAGLWMLAFLILPLAGLIALSVTRSGAYGNILWELNLDNFMRALQPKYLPIVLRTVAYAGTATLLSLALGYPLAYYLSLRAGGLRETLMILLMVPFWTSCLIAIYSWIIILGREGLLNNLLHGLGVTRAPLEFLNTPFSVLLGLVYFYLPFMVLPLYGSLEKIPRALLEASADLGGGTMTTFLRITLPLSLPGIFAGCLLTFIPCLGDFLVAEFMGGPNTYLLGNLVQNQFLMAQDWPFGSALTALLIASMLSGLYFYQRLEGRELENQGLEKV